jgi:hypothetical protein
VPHHLKNASNIVQQEWFKVWTWFWHTVISILLEVLASDLCLEITYPDWDIFMLNLQIDCNYFHILHNLFTCYHGMWRYTTCTVDIISFVWTQWCHPSLLAKVFYSSSHYFSGFLNSLGNQNVW